jgi:hypothetical protein
MSFYENMKHLRKEIDSPPGQGWVRENKSGAHHTLGPIGPKELNGILAELIAEKLSATHEQKEQLKDWLMEQGVEQVAEHLLGDTNPVGLAMKAAQCFSFLGKIGFYNGKRKHLAPGVNAYQPDEEPERFVDFLLWDWQKNNEWRDMSSKKSTASPYGF